MIMAAAWIFGAFAMQNGTAQCAAVPATTWNSVHQAFAQRKLDEALRILEPLEARAPSCWKLHVALGRARLGRGELRQAAASAGQAIRFGPNEFDALMFQGEMVAMQGRSAEAQALLEKATRLQPKNPDAWFQLGSLFDSRKAHPESVAAFRKAVSLRPGDARAWDFLALHLEALGQVDEAEAAYRRGLAVNSPPFHDPFLDYNFGRLLAKRNRLPESLQHLDKALKSAPPTRAIHYERSRILFRLGRMPEARTDAEKAASLPDAGGYILDLQVYNLLVQIYNRMGERDLATRFVELAKKATVPLQGRDRGIGESTGASPAPAADTEPAPLEVAKRLIAEGNLQQAIALLRQSTASDGNDADAHLLLGTALALVPSRSEAIAELKKSIELKPDNARAHQTLANALARFGDFDGARVSYEKALSIDPNLSEAHAQLGMVLAAQEKLDSAVEHFSKAIAAKPDAPEAGAWYYLRAKAFLQRDQAGKAAQDLATSVRLQPGNARAWLDLGVARAQTGDDAAALEALERAASLAPKDPDALFHLGATYLKTGNPVRAISPLREADKLRPGQRTTLYALARALQATGDTAAAQPILQQLSTQSQVQTRDDPDLLKSGKLNNEGVALEGEGKHAEALEKYRAALAISPGQIEFRRNLALVLCRLNRWKEAVPELKAILKDAPGDVDATRALYVALEHAPELR